MSTWPSNFLRSQFNCATALEQVWSTASPPWLKTSRCAQWCLAPGLWMCFPYVIKGWVVEPPWLPWIFHQIRAFEIQMPVRALRPLSINLYLHPQIIPANVCREGPIFLLMGWWYMAASTHISRTSIEFSPAEHLIVTSWFMSFISPVSPLNVLTDGRSKCSYRYGFFKVKPSWRGHGAAAAIPFIWSKSFSLEDILTYRGMKNTEANKHSITSTNFTHCCVYRSWGKNTKVELNLLQPSHPDTMFATMVSAKDSQSKIDICIKRGLSQVIGGLSGWWWCCYRPQGCQAGDHSLNKPFVFSNPNQAEHKHCFERGIENSA